MVKGNCARITHAVNHTGYVCGQPQSDSAQNEVQSTLLRRTRSWRSSANPAEQALPDANASGMTLQLPPVLCSLKAFSQTTIRFSAIAGRRHGYPDKQTARAVQRHRESVHMQEATVCKIQSRDGVEIRTMVQLLTLKELDDVGYRHFAVPHSSLPPIQPMASNGLQRAVHGSVDGACPIRYLNRSCLFVVRACQFV